MTEKIRKKAEVIAAIALVLLSALVVAGTAHALEPKKGAIDFVLLYDDVETGDSYFLSNVEVNLYDMDGNYVAHTSSTNGIVDFSNIPYGNYIVRTVPTVKNVDNESYLYTTSFTYVHLDGNGVKDLSTGASFTKMTVSRYPITHMVNLTITKNGEPIVANVNVSFEGFTYAHYTVSGNISFNVVKGTSVLKIIYNDGGVYKDYYKEINMAAKSLNVSVDIGTYHKVIGTVMSGGKVVNTTTHVIVINKATGNVWKVLTFPGGAFSFFLPSSNYKLIVKADGYGYKVYNSVPSSLIVTQVNKAIRNVDYTISFSKDMKWMNVTYSTTITNDTVLEGLPYTNTGILYYQMKMLGWKPQNVVSFVESTYYHYSDKILTVNGNMYEIKGSPSFTSTAPNPNMVFSVKIHVSYYNADICKDKMLKSGDIKVELNAEKDHIAGEQLKYTYTISIPSDLERSNDVATSVANVSGFVNTITVSDVMSSPITLVLKERKRPEITLDTSHFVVGWKSMSSVNHVVNQSAKNYTIVVPSNTDVWFNASKMVYDVVRERYDVNNTTFQWTLDGKTLHTHAANITLTAKQLTAGKHILNIKVTDIGKNTNETNVTILADGAHPIVNMSVKDPSGKVLIHIWENNNNPNKLYYTFGNSKKVNVTAVVNGIVNIPVKLAFNQTEEMVYDAENSFDTYTYNFKDKTHLPVIVEWNFNGNKSTGANRTYAFDKPTRGSPYCVNVTFTDSVNNTIKVSMMVEVRDITKPVIKLNLTSNGKRVDEVKEGELVTLDATGSYDPDNGTIVSYNWTIKDENYKIIYNNYYKPNCDVCSIVNMNNKTNPSNITVKFTKFGTYYIILNITDGAGNYNVVNKTLRVTPVRPDLSINSVSIKGDRYEGSKLTFVVNVSNNGNAPTSSFWVALYVHGKVVYNHTFKTELKNETYKIVDAYWTPSSPGNYTVTVKVGCKNEPASYLSDNTKKETVKIDMAPWKLPAMIGGSIAIIVLVGFVAWRYMQKREEQKKFKKGKNKGGKKEGGKKGKE